MIWNRVHRTGTSRVNANVCSVVCVVYAEVLRVREDSSSGGSSSSRQSGNQACVVSRQLNCARPTNSGRIGESSSCSCISGIYGHGLTRWGVSVRVGVGGGRGGIYPQSAQGGSGAGDLNKVCRVFSRFRRV